MIPFGMSPEDRAEYEQHVNEMREKFVTQRTATQAALKDMFNNMSIEDLVTFRRLMHAIGNHPEDPGSLAMFFEGRAHALLVHVHEVCPRCGVDHADEDLKAMLDSQCNDDASHDPDLGMDTA